MSKAQSVSFLLSQVRASGIALAGGSAEFFEAGTSTPKTIWLDRDKANTAVNPYELDANGTAQLFADGVYRVVIKDSTGAEKYDRDGLSFKDGSNLAYDVADYSSLAAAVVSIGSTNATLQFTSDITISSNLVVPDNIELMPLNGAKINHGVYTISYAGSTARWPIAQIFNGSGDVSLGTGGVSTSKEVFVEWFTTNIVPGTTDVTAGIDKALTISHNAGIPVRGLATTYACSGVDFVGKDNATFIGEPQREYGTTIFKTIGAATIMVGAETVFIRINDKAVTGASAGAAVRNIGLSNVYVQESATSTRDRGIYATYCPHLELKGVHTTGFTKAIRLALCWNSKVEDVHAYNFRTSGYSFAEGDSYFAATNGLELSSVHASSTTTTPECNFDLRGVTSVEFLNLVTEGACTNHFRVDASTRSVSVNNLHLEGGGNVLMMELSGTQTFCQFNVYGGTLFLPAVANTKFANWNGATANVGLEMLGLYGVQIIKPVAVLPTDYFDLSRVAGFAFTGDIPYCSTAANDMLTWINLAKDTGIANSKFYFGNDGRWFARSRVFMGHPNSYRVVRNLTSIGTTAAAASTIASLEAGNNRWRSAEITVMRSDNGGTSADGSNFYARFAVAISRNFATIAQSTVASAGTLASAVTFVCNTTISGAVDNGAGLIRVTSTAHGLTTGEVVVVAGVTGTTEANGIRAVTVIDANTFDLQGSAFVNAYVSGGTVSNGSLRAYSATASGQFHFQTDVMETTP